MLDGFKENPGSKLGVTDRETKVEIDLHPGPGAFPIPTVVSDQPQIIRLDGMISSKLSTYLGRGMERAQDYADVVKLIQANFLPRDFLPLKLGR